MPFDLWLLVMGALLLVMALLHPYVQRLPITSAIVYLFVGVVLGPIGFGVVWIDPVANPELLLRMTEIAVIISLFTVGMKLRLPVNAPRLRPALCLASVSMILTVLLVATAGVFWLHLSIGEAVLLGAILAPTDPVLASEVQIRDPRDQDKIRLTLSAEAGLNDGTAFPFVMLGLGLLGLHDVGVHGWRWWTVDVLWATCGGLAIGAALGHGLGRLMLYLQTRRATVVAFGEYLVLGLIGVSYGAAVQLHAYGFLSVFAAALALRAVERRASPSPAVLDASMAATSGGVGGDALAANPKTAPAYFAGVLLATNEQLGHILEVGLVLIVGASLLVAGLSYQALWFAPLLFLVIRPISALPLFLTGRFSRLEFGSVAWFGIRGIGSVYYLMYAIQHGLAGSTAREFTSLTLTIVALSIIAHGVSVTPLLSYHRRRTTTVRADRTNRPGQPTGNQEPGSGSL